MENKHPSVVFTTTNAVEEATTSDDSDDDIFARLAVRERKAAKTERKSCHETKPLQRVYERLDAILRRARADGTRKRTVRQRG